MWPFNCKCRAKYLMVVKDETVDPQPERTETYARERSIHVTYHLYCMMCNKHHDITYSRTEVFEEY